MAVCGVVRHLVAPQDVRLPDSFHEVGVLHCRQAHRQLQVILAAVPAAGDDADENPVDDDPGQDCGCSSDHQHIGESPNEDRSGGRDIQGEDEGGRGEDARSGVGPHSHQSMDQDDEGEQVHDFDGQILVRRQPDRVVEEDVLLAEEGEEQSEGEDGDEEGDEAGVHEAHEELQSDERLLGGVVEGEARDGAVGFLLDGDLVGVLVLALPLDPPDQEGSLQAEHEQLNGGQHSSDDEEVGVVGGDDGEPVAVEVREDGQPVEVDEADPLQVGHALEPEDVAVQDQGQQGRVYVVRDQHSHEDEAVLPGLGRRLQQVLGDQRHDHDQDHIGDGRHQRSPHLQQVGDQDVPFDVGAGILDRTVHIDQVEVGIAVAEEGLGVTG